MPMFVNLPSKHSSIPFPTHPFSPLPLIPAHTTMHIPISCHWASIASLDCVKCLSCLFAYVKCFIRLPYVHTHTYSIEYILIHTYILATLALAQVPPLTRLPRLSQQSCQYVPHSSAAKNFHTKRYSIYQIYPIYYCCLLYVFLYMFPRLMFIAFYDVNRIIFWHTLA